MDKYDVISEKVKLYTIFPVMVSFVLHIVSLVVYYMTASLPHWVTIMMMVFDIVSSIWCVAFIGFFIADRVVYYIRDKREEAKNVNGLL